MFLFRSTAGFVCMACTQPALSRFSNAMHFHSFNSFIFIHSFIYLFIHSFIHSFRLLSEREDDRLLHTVDPHRIRNTLVKFRPCELLVVNFSAEHVSGA